MAVGVNSLQQIKLDLEASVGKRVKLRNKSRRKKIIEAEGVIRQHTQNSLW